MTTLAKEAVRVTLSLTLLLLWVVLEVLVTAAAVSLLVAADELPPLVQNAHANFNTIRQTAFFTQVTIERFAFFSARNLACF